MTKQFQHCYIAPTSYLHMIPKEANIHLLLAHLLTDEKYVEFYRQRKEAGDYIIVDNGAFEFKRPLEADELFRLIGNAKLTPDVVVAPDYPFEDWSKTVESTLSFSQRYHEYFDKSVKLMAVPQSIKGDFEGWLACYAALNTIDHVEWIGMSILGIPNAFCLLTGTNDITFNRTFATAYMKERGLIADHVKHHYLGCSDPREILMMKTMGVADTNDSSTAFWHGINGIRFDDSKGGLINGKIQLEVDFNYPFDDADVENVRYNMNWIEKILL